MLSENTKYFFDKNEYFHCHLTDTVLSDTSTIKMSQKVHNYKSITFYIHTVYFKLT